MMAPEKMCGLPAANIAELKLKGFKVNKISVAANASISYSRRDFYKLVLVTGDMTINYGGQKLEATDTFLFLGSPHVPHSVVNHTAHSGYSSLFTEEFIGNRDWWKMLQHSPLFRFGGVPFIPVNDTQATFINGIFEKMLSIYSGNYDHKDEMLRNCIELIIHEAISLQPSQNELPHNNASTRITNLFMELLEKQFPIDNAENPLRLRTPQDFAASLSVHVNYLNRSIKEMTGKPTSVHISERIAAEAKALLQHTDWSVADIAYGLGFEYPTYFNNYFKRVTGVTPKSFRA